jgi:hypothetical protein
MPPVRPSGTSMLNSNLGCGLRINLYPAAHTWHRHVQAPAYLPALCSSAGTSAIIVDVGPNKLRACCSYIVVEIDNRARVPIPSAPQVCWHQHDD